MSHLQKVERCISAAPHNSFSHSASKQSVIGIWALHLRGLVFKKEIMGAIVCWASGGFTLPIA